MIVLALNSGSSSLKFGVCEMAEPFAWRFEGQVEAMGGESRFVVRDAAGQVTVDEHEPIADAGAALERIERWFQESGQALPDAVGHRVVHGGPRLRRHCRIDAEVLRQLEAAKAFAPLHVPPALAVIRGASERFPRAVQVACFDTAFHATLPDVSRTLPIALRWREDGVERYGFHGLSCESIVRQLQAPPPRLVIAHLGNGASITAVENGRSIATSMGLTPSGGVVMGSRSGDLDPGALIYLLREKGLDAEALEQLIDHDSGLKGISGLSNDMRKLHEAAPKNADADLAVRMFCLSVRQQVAAMVATLGGVDLLVFTGGIGENDVEVRGDVLRGLNWIGLPFETRVLPSQEDEQIARHTAELAGPSP